MNHVTLNHHGMVNVKKLFEEWKVFSKNQAKLTKTFVLPNYFFVINPEISVGHILNMIVDVCEEENLVEFNNDNVKAYLYYLVYVNKEATEFPSFREFFNIYFENLCKHDNPYKGILCIDITAWVEALGCSDDKFIAFLDFMSTIDKDTLAIFVSKSANNEKNNIAFKQLLTKTRIRRIEIGEIKEQEGYDFLVKIVNKSGLTINENAKAKLLEIVSFILSIDGNEGLKSIHQIAYEIIYDVLCTEGTNFEIDEQVLSKYGPNTEWAKTFETTRKLYLGFNI